jgi:exodeoxyribonuclease-3
VKLLSWNVNGYRSVLQKGFLDWFQKEAADIVCLQETKAHPGQLDVFALNPHGYHSVFASAKKPGYSGVAVFSKKEPLSVQVGFGHDEFDSEGRTLVCEYKDFVLINSYFPNSQREGQRLSYKIKFCEAMLEFCQDLRKKGKNVIVCGDLNIAHNPIDLANPKTNEKNAGYLPEERAWMTKFLAAGYTDTFRLFEKGPGNYTWWSYRPGIRDRNIGWRLDYHVTNQEMNDRIKKAYHLPHIIGSDHCPVGLEIKN